MSPKVLVTGGTGFAASHIVFELLRRGYEVIGTVRSESKGKAFLASFPEPTSLSATASLGYAIVPDIGISSAFDNVIQNGAFDGVIHPATPFHYNITTPSDLLNPAIEGTLNILRAVQNYGPTVKRVVITSSGASVMHKGVIIPGKVYTEHDWCPITWDEANSGDGSDAYWGAKKFSEKAAWDFMGKEKPHFSLSVCCPPWIFGPIIHPVDSIDSLNTSASFLYGFFNGSMKEIPPQSLLAWVDVRDLAVAHVEALFRPQAANQRFLVCGGIFTHKQVATILRKRFPSRAASVPDPEALPTGLNSDGWPTAGHYDWDTRKSRDVLGVKYRSLEDMLVDFVRSMEKLEKH